MLLDEDFLPKMPQTNIMSFFNAIVIWQISDPSNQGRTFNVHVNIQTKFLAAKKRQKKPELRLDML